MTKMHENEFLINESMVQKLLDEQCPFLANLPLTPIPSTGTEHTLFRLGKDYIIRLPRVEWSIESVNKTIEKEFKWVPQLAKSLKMSIAEPIFKGKPANDYPWSWTIAKWNDGHNPDFEKADEYNLLAKDLAYFLNDLHSVTLPNGPLSRRGLPLLKLDIETKKAIAELEGEINTQTVTELWTQLLNIPIWNHSHVWVHGDFLPGNILVKNNRLNAVIDFSDLGVGDPACDLIIAWSLFNSASRQLFRTYLENIDNDTWERGRGWALSIALIMLPYYKYSNPTMATLARIMINNVINNA
ncbi:MAG: aminoglycoside phosphotransferase family protein [Neisseriales bacterium]|nr:MAG: aminoglycoside phosphotransferase family protein [Neisseriales bacterium]